MLFRSLKNQEKLILKPSNANIDATLNLVNNMISLATKGDTEREDTGCGILYGVILDSAYKIKKVAECEKTSHIQKGKWDGNA